MKYMVHYIAGNGETRHFTFKTDRSFRVYRNNASTNGLGLGNPFFEDMCYAAAQIGKRPDSNMTVSGGFCWNRIKRIKCIDTGETKYF